MNHNRNISRETSPACILHHSLTEDFQEIEREDLISVEKDWQSIFIGEEPAESGLFNKDLQSLVSKLEILRSFSALTQDIVLAEQIAEAMQNYQEGVNKDIENKDGDLIYAWQICYRMNTSNLMKNKNYGRKNHCATIPSLNRVR